MLVAVSHTQSGMALQTMVCDGVGIQHMTKSAGDNLGQKDVTRNIWLP